MNETATPKIILLVEDEAIIAMALSQSLKDFGYEVAVALSGEEAVRMAAGPGRIDLILMDIDLGKGIDGAEAAATILASRRLPVVFLSSHSERTIVERVRGIARYGYVLKNSGGFVLQSSIEMAFELFDAHESARENAESNQRLLSERLEKSLRWRHIFDAITDSVSVISTSFQMLDLNEAGARSLGIERDGILGKQCYEVVHCMGHPIDACPCRAAMESGRPEIREYEAAGRHYSLEAWPIRGMDGSVESFVHIVKDVTERLLAENSRDEIEAHFQRLFSSVMDYVFSVEVEGGKAVRTIHGLGCETVTGYSVEDYRKDGFLWYRMVHPDDREAVTAQARGAIEGRGGTTLEHRIIHRDGSLRWVRNTTVPRCGEDGSVTGYDCVIADVTERRRAEETVRTANLRLEALWNISSLGETDEKTVFDHVLSDIIRMTESDYGFLGFLDENETLMTIPNWSGEAMKDCSMPVKPRHYEISMGGIWAEAVRHRQPLILNDFAVPNEAKKGYPAGHVPLVRLMVVPVFTEGKIVTVAAVANKESDYDDADLKQVTAFLNGVQAIMDRRRVEEKVRNLLAEKELILHEVHHRIKNNMSSISGFLSIQASLQQDERVVAALKDAQRRLISMGLLYDKLYRSENSLELSVSDYLPSLAREIVREFPHASSIEVISRIATFALDAKKLSVLGILVNELIANAMKYAFVGRGSGSITITATMIDKRVRMTIEDDGIGLPRSIDPDNSSGFGLRLASELVKQLAGTMRIERNSGTKFILDFEA